MSKQKGPSYEEAMQELSQIVETLSAGNVSLDDMVKLYERGDALSKHCLAILDGYEARLDVVDAAEAAQ